MSINDTKAENLKNNLAVQVDKIFRETRDGGFKTRARYKEANHRFAGFLAQEFRLQKFKNVSEKHFIAYTKQMQSEGKSAATIKTDLGAIRYAHSRSGSRNPLPDNSNLNLERRRYGRYDRAWTPREVENAKVLALEQGNPKVYHAINLSSNFGSRLEDTAKITVRDVENALGHGSLRLKEKGGITRYVPITMTQQRETLQGALDWAKGQGRRGADTILVDKYKGSTKKIIASLSNWVYNHRDKFADKSIRASKYREAVNAKAAEIGYKPRNKRITFHGLRYKYAQDRYNELRGQGVEERFAKKVVAENLGHHRTEITNIYLSKK